MVEGTSVITWVGGKSSKQVVSSHPLLDLPKNEEGNHLFLFRSSGALIITIRIEEGNK
jgi:hypothetical protein